jgi:hypothetical protein
MCTKQALIIGMQLHARGAGHASTSIGSAFCVRTQVCSAKLVSTCRFVVWLYTHAPQQAMSLVYMCAEVHSLLTRRGSNMGVITFILRSALDAPGKVVMFSRFSV